MRGLYVFLALGGAVVVSGVAAILFSSTTSAAEVTRESTNMQTMGYGNGRMVFHAISRTSDVNVQSTELGVYYDEWSGNKSIDILRPQTSQGASSNASTVCRVNPSGNNTRVQVEVHRQGHNRIVYNVHRNQVCSGQGLYRNFSLGSRPSARDPGTGMYLARVVVKFTDGTPASGNQVMFRVRAQAGGGPKVAPLGGRVMGTDSARGATQPRSYTRQQFIFGAPCNRTQTLWKRVTVTDPDNNDGRAQVGRFTFLVYANNSLVPSGDVRNLVRMGRQSHNGHYYPLEGTPNNSTSSLELRIRPNTSYRIVMFNVDTNNTIEMTIPEDSIYYNFDCSSRTDWRLSPKVSLNNNNNQPGQDIQWRHWFENDGPAAFNRNIDYRAENRSGFPNNNTIANWSRGTPYFGKGGSSQNQYTTYRIQPNDAGKTLCRVTSLTPGSMTRNNVGGRVTSGEACRSIPYGYSLNPTISRPTPGVIEGDQINISVQGVINNSGATKSHNNINWRLIRVTFPPGTAPSNAGGGRNSSTNLPCNGYYPGSSSCTYLSNGTRNNGINQNGSFSNTQTTNIVNQPVGTRICFAMSVQRNSSSNAAAGLGWRMSSLNCLVVGKSPKVQIHGGALSVGRTFAGASMTGSQVMTSTTQQPGGRTFGSWAEYGVFAPNSINRTASSSGLNNGSTSNQMSAWSRLTYTNTGNGSNCPGGYGCYNLNGSLPDPGQRFPIIASTHRVSSVDVGSRTGVVTNNPGVSPVINVTGGEIGAGRHLVINAPNATVNITGSIRYQNGSFQRANQIPQVIIIARTINIRHTVNRVDAWLVAKGPTSSIAGIVNTCSTNNDNSSLAVNARLSSNVCSRQLTINGPVIADRLYLRRTAGSNPGSDAARSEPAEIINLRPDAYLWAHENMTTRSTLRTTSVIERPPRL